MIPNCGPAHTDSRGEQLVYYLLKEKLSNDFTVVHSLPWLSAAARGNASNKAITGEIDFLIVHADLGVLAVEIKGGAHKVHALAFVHIKSGTATRAVEQVRASTHGLAKWLGVNPGLRQKLGYALVFPHSDFKDQIVSTALTDVTADPPESIVIDKSGLLTLGQRIVEIMTYWKRALSNPPLGEETIKALLATICPSFDGSPSWGSRVAWDNEIWLRLTPEQSTVVDDAAAGSRLVVTGWPGTGKTLVLIESARRMLAEGKHVLVLTFNTLLAQFIQKQIGNSWLLKVCTWHSFCGLAAERSQHKKVEGDRDWLDHGCLDDLRSADLRGELKPFDAMLLDEAQTFKTEWLEWLCSWHSGKQLLAFCDETQVFAFEEGRVTLAKLCTLVGVERPFVLTSVLRSPRAVYQRLQSVKKSEYQLHMPRELEVDTLEEVLVVGMTTAVQHTLTDLEDKGIPDSDIVVLDKFGWAVADYKKWGIQGHTLSRFRGMESPVVVIAGAEQMDDIELFCAYSRATTLCIALYDAEVLGVKGASCLFQASLLAIPTNSEEAERARLSAQTGEIVQTRLKPSWIDLKTIDIGWVSRWHAWVLVLRDEISPYWIDYLASHYPWPIYYWDEWSLRTVQQATAVSSAIADVPGGVPHGLYQCNKCEILTPQKRDPLTFDEVWLCAICESKDMDLPPRPDDQNLDEIRALDDLLTVEDPKSISEAERKRLPLSLATGAALQFAKRKSRGELVGLDQISTGRIAYHAALGFVCSLMNLFPPGKSIKVASTAEELYGRYLIPQGLTLELWKRDFALACGVAYKRGQLEKIAKGVYTPKRA